MKTKTRLLIAGLVMLSAMVVFTGTAAADWVNPTGYGDPSNTWSSEEEAYDDDLITGACWISEFCEPGSYECLDMCYLELTIEEPISCDEIRLYAPFAPMFPLKIEVWVYKDGSWISVYDDYAPEGWQHMEFPKGTVTKAVVRPFIPILPGLPEEAYDGQYFINEFDFWEVEEPTPTPVVPATGGDPVYFSSSSGAIEDLTAIPGDAYGAPPEGVNLEYGLFRFNIIGITPGDAVTITLEFPDNLPVDAEYWKYGKTQSDPTDHWYEIFVGDNDGDNVITITLTDGGLGDDDLTANGVIVDDGGPSIPSGPVPYVVSSDISGAERNTFDLSDDVYCYAGNLPASTDVRIYVVGNKDVWNDDDVLTDVSGGYETKTTESDGSIANTKIWSATLTEGEYDIVVDTNRNGKWNTGEPIDNEVDVGFTAVPEFTTIAIPVAAILGLVFLISRRGRHSRRNN